MTENKDTEKYTWGSERFNTPFNPGFRSRGISPSYLGSDSLPQGIADLHWALHGIQDNMDKLDARMGSFESNIVKISDGIKDETFKFISDKLAGSKTPLMTNTGYISKIVTTRQRIFSDSFGPETEMNPRNRISGFTENYHWVQYNQKNPNCDGVWDKIIDFDFVADHQQDDKVDSRYVTKGKIILEKVGLINRIHVTQKGTNIVVWYLLSQSMPTDTGVAYTGAIRRVEYNKDAELVAESFVSVNHTPLVLIGSFSADSNNEQEFIQYISTDYKLYQNHEGNDKELGQLPNDVITMIDPVNDLLSDSKTAYIMKYSNEGKLLMPLKGFTVTDTLESGKIVPRFKIIEFNNQTELFKSFVSISPRNQTTLVREFKNDEEMFVEGGYYVELYDINTTKPSTQHSHHFLLSSTEEVYDLDRFAPNIMDAHSVKPSAFSFKRERDYTEFRKITFDGGITKMFPEIAGDFGIGDDVPFTLEFDDSKTTEKITIHLKEPFVLTRDISTVEVNNRRGFTVLNNSDFVKDVSAPSILSVYRNLRFINPSNPGVRNYLKTMRNYDESYVLPAFFEYNVVKSTEQENQEGILEVTYFDKDREIKVTIDTKTGNIVGNINFDECFTNSYVSSGVKSPVDNNYLSKLTNSGIVHLQGSNSHLDKPTDSANYVLINKSLGNSIVQKLISYDTKIVGRLPETVTFTRSIQESKVSEWEGHGYINKIRYLNIPGTYYIRLLGNNTAEFVKSLNKTHPIFTRDNNVRIEVTGYSTTENFVTLNISDTEGLCMEYHNIVVTPEREPLIGRTSKSYTLKYPSWIPGKFIGNAETKFGPEHDSVTKELLRRIGWLYAHDLKVEDTSSVDLTKTVTGVNENLNLNTGEWEFPNHSSSVKADVKISSAKETLEVKSKSDNPVNGRSITTKTIQVSNGTSIKDDGVWSADYSGVLSNLNKAIEDLDNRVYNNSTASSNLATRVSTLEKVLGNIVDSLRSAGAWDNGANYTPTVPLRGGLKEGVNIAYGNINLFGGTPDGNSYIRTNSGSTNNDLAGGI